MAPPPALRLRLWVLQPGLHLASGPLSAGPGAGLGKSWCSEGGQRDILPSL